MLCQCVALHASQAGPLHLTTPRSPPSPLADVKSGQESVVRTVNLSLADSGIRARPPSMATRTLTPMGGLPGLQHLEQPPMDGHNSASISKATIQSTRWKRKTTQQPQETSGTAPTTKTKETAGPTRMQTCRATWPRTQTASPRAWSSACAIPSRAPALRSLGSLPYQTAQQPSNHQKSPVAQTTRSRFHIPFPTDTTRLSQQYHHQRHNRCRHHRSRPSLKMPATPPTGPSSLPLSHRNSLTATLRPLTHHLLQQRTSPRLPCPTRKPL